MSTRNRTGAPPGRTSRPAARPQRHGGAHAHEPAEQATTPDPQRQAQALSNQGAQRGLGSPWLHLGDEDEEDDTPPTLH